MAWELAGLRRHGDDEAAEAYRDKFFALARERFGVSRRTGARKIRLAETELRRRRDLGKDALSI